MDGERRKIIGIWATVGLVIVLAVVGGLLVPQAYRKYEQGAGRTLPNIQALERDLEVVEQSGRTVRFGELRGKIWVVGYVFTTCPGGCLGLTQEMASLQKEFAGDPDLHFVSVSVDPEHDRPEVLREWTSKSGVGGENWWFVTGDAKEIRNYMAKYFRFPVTENTDPETVAQQGRWVHDTRLVAVDRRGMIRGYYDVLNLRSGDIYRKQLLEDIALLKAEPMPAGSEEREPSL